MALHLYDTLRGRKVPFEPLEPGRVTMYLCGPTVYNYAHIGNARPAVVFDVLVRLLRCRYTVVFARNFTDVDDKINAAAADSGKPIGEITERFIEAYREDMAALGVLAPDIEPRATEHIDAMVAMIETLIDRGHAYEAEGHVLFEVATFADYGQLSRRDLREMIAGARVEVAPYKRSPQDFVLWKPSTPELPGWDSPWGRGRPGWHIECSAMSAKHLGRTIDIHAGGRDLVFPHHENEVAQSVCAHEGEAFARYWLHNGFLSVDSTKMSKSLGNVLLVHDMVRTIPGEVIRMALLSAHYRQPLDWSDTTVTEAKKKLDRLYQAIRPLEVTSELRANTPVPAPVTEALEDDLNTPKALAAMFDIVRSLNKAEDAATQRAQAASLQAAGDVLGLLREDPERWFAGQGAAQESGLSDEEIRALLERRDAARTAKDFGEADRLRDRLAAHGIVVQDGVGGSRWRRK